MLTTYASYRLVAADLDRSMQRAASEPVAAREIAYWKETIGEVKSIDDLVGDRRLFAFAMKAFGLGDMAYAKAFVRKILEGGVADEASMANRLADPRYRQFAKTFDFARLGPFTTGMPEVKTEVVDKYLRQSLEESAGATNEGVRLALYFQRKAGELTSPMQVLADPALLKVVQTAFSLPASMSGASIDKQAEMIAGKIDVATLKDPAVLERTLKRFSALHDLSSGAAVAASPALAINAAAGQGVGVDTLMSLARLKTGG